jgi:hypothetical protein
LTHSTASSIEFTFQIQKPAMSSLVSANGPSVTVRFVPEKWTPLAHANWPAASSPANITPAFHQFLVELAHFLHDLRIRGRARFRLLAGLDHHHHSHRRSSLLSGRNGKSRSTEPFER